MTAKKQAVVDSEQLAEDGNIDKIRDILFGVQVRDFERRFSKLEEKIDKDLDDLKQDTRDQLNKLEELMTKEVNALTDKIYEEQDLRGDALKKLTSDLQNASRDLEKQITKLGEKTAKNESEIRTQILDESKALTDTIQKKQDETLASLKKEATELRDDKADRAALADLFTEMAMRLTGDFKLPKSKKESK